jgi:hypothetical protein
MVLIVQTGQSCGLLESELQLFRQMEILVASPLWQTLREYLCPRLLLWLLFIRSEKKRGNLCISYGQYFLVQKLVSLFVLNPGHHTEPLVSSPLSPSFLYSEQNFSVYTAAADSYLGKEQPQPKNARWSRQDGQGPKARNYIICTINTFYLDMTLLIFLDC